MNLSGFLPPDALEKPLDVLKDDGGFTAVFRTLAVIGDSLAAGDLESLTPEGVRDFHDNHDISWAQFLARMSGITVPFHCSFGHAILLAIYLFLFFLPGFLLFLEI